MNYIPVIRSSSGRIISIIRGEERNQRQNELNDDESYYPLHDRSLALSLEMMNTAKLKTKLIKFV